MKTSVHMDMSVLTEELCGSRPVHFRRCIKAVVTKLFNIVQPDNLGQKDAQQLVIIKTHGSGFKHGH